MKKVDEANIQMTVSKDEEGGDNGGNNGNNGNGSGAMLLGLLVVGAFALEKSS